MDGTRTEAVAELGRLRDHIATMSAGASKTALSASYTRFLTLLAETHALGHLGGLELPPPA